MDRGVSGVTGASATNAMVDGTKIKEEHGEGGKTGKRFEARYIMRCRSLWYDLYLCADLT